jgi:hypothetical protein
MLRLETTIIATIIALLVVSSSAVAQAPDLLYLPFNEGSGQTTADLAVPGQGTAPGLVGLAAWDPSPALGNAALLMATGATSADHAQTNLPFVLSGSWTLEFWCRNDDSSSTLRYILGDSTAGSFRCYKSGASPASILFAGTGVTSLTLPAALPTGQWVHIAFSYDDLGRTLSGFVDGQLVGAKIQAGNLSFSGTGAAGLLVGGYGTSTPIIGAIDELRLYSYARDEGEIDRDRFNEQQSFALDVALSRVSAPLDSAGCDPLDVAETVSFSVRNAGTSAIPAGSLITASYTIDGGAPTSEAFLTSAPLTPSSVLHLSFAAGADLSAAGQHTIAVTASIAGDASPLNNGLLKVVRSGGLAVVSTFPWVENFDASASINTTVPPSAWLQDQADASGTDSDWYFRSGSTTSANTGPSGDYTSGAGYYAYVEDSSGNFAQVNLSTPCLDLGTLSSPMLQFALHSMNGASPSTVNENFIAVDVIAYPGGILNLDVLGPIGHLGSSWTLQSASLAAFAGQTVQIRFRGRSDGGSFTHDIAIDDVSVFEQQIAMGQAPRAGLAVFDLNAAANLNMLPVSSGAAGPYLAGAAAGGPLVMTFEGEANQPVLLLHGQANVQAASYPMVGQFDIGGPLGVNGVPTLISVVGNGFAPANLIHAFFTTGPSGSVSMTFQTPPFPPGPAGALQAVIGNGQSYLVGITNAIELAIL